MNLRLLLFCVSPSLHLLACTGVESPPAKAPEEAHVSLVAAASIATEPPAEPDWTGNYNASWVAPGTSGVSGVKVYVDYHILLKRSARGLVAYVSADGWQTMMRLVGDATPSADGRELAVRFADCGADDMYQCSSFHKGDLLFSIVRRAEGAAILALSTNMTPDLARRDLPLTKD
jgi:hypothetical protein